MLFAVITGQAVTYFHLTQIHLLGLMTSRLRAQHELKAQQV
jgi:hypothetical protein